MVVDRGTVVTVTDCELCGFNHDGDVYTGVELLTDHEGEYFMCVLEKEKVYFK